MKKMKYLLGAVALVASLSAFTVPLKQDCADSYVYQGTGNPFSNPQSNSDFVLTGDVGGCNTFTVDYSCEWIKTGENQFVPCPQSTTEGKYTRPTNVRIVK